MPAARRGRSHLSSRPYYSVAGPCSSRGWLSVRRKHYKRARRPAEPNSDDDGIQQLSDEILLAIFAGFSDIADLIRCAATCSRWRRIVSGDAAFICCTPRRPGRFIRSLALGFFHQVAGGASNEAIPRFVPTVSATRLLGLRQPPALKTLVEGLDDGLFDGSRLVASRNGLLVVDLRRGKHYRALKLCVCNHMTGQVDILPPLTGKDNLGHYACTVLTTDDLDQNSDPPPTRSSPSPYRLLLVYSRRGFTAFRSYAPDEGSWSAEAKVTNARLGKKQMGLTRAGVVARGGKVVYWLANYVAFGLRLDTLEAAVVKLPRYVSESNTLLGVSMEGRLCAVYIQGPYLRTPACRSVYSISVFTQKNHDGADALSLDCDWEPEEELIHFPAAEVDGVKLRWFCEKSGVVFFTTGCSDGRSEVYALSLDKHKVEKVASHSGGGGGDPWGNFHGYEMDRAAYLASIGEPNEED